MLAGWWRVVVGRGLSSVFGTVRGVWVTERGGSSAIGRPEGNPPPNLAGGSDSRYGICRDITSVDAENHDLCPFAASLAAVVRSPAEVARVVQFVMTACS